MYGKPALSSKKNNIIHVRLYASDSVCMIVHVHHIYTYWVVALNKWIATSYTSFQCKWLS
jgi:hypothetical protein